MLIGVYASQCVSYVRLCGRVVMYVYDVVIVTVLAGAYALLPQRDKLVGSWVQKGMGGGMRLWLFRKTNLH